MTFRFVNIFFATFFLICFCNLTFSQKKQKFTIVLDAGHGGKDFGANYHGFVEKKITLAIIEKIGRILENHSDIYIIYTRKTDDFIELKERADIANRNNANLFISVHCNADRNTIINGTETYVIGLSRADMNLEVAKSENSVIFLEDNYKQTYKGFDPSTPETLIGLKLIQENNLTNSISLATKIQENFKSNKIKSRGVKQEPLWVLDATIMPGVLIETGFISNNAEGGRLNSESGQLDSATAIAQAILEYKNEYLGDSDDSVKTNKSEKKNIEPPQSTETTEKNNKKTGISKKERVVKSHENDASDKNTDVSESVIFKVQISSGSKKKDLIRKNFKGLNNISYEYENGLYKYFYGATSDYRTVKGLIKEARIHGYKNAFLVAFKNGKKISVMESIK